MNKQNIIDRIKAGTIETNFSDFPKTINGFTRDEILVGDNVAKCNISHVNYTRGNDLGYVTAEDLAAGKLQVRKIDQVTPEGGGRKVAVPSEQVW